MNMNTINVQDAPAEVQAWMKKYSRKRKVIVGEISGLRFRRSACFWDGGSYTAENLWNSQLTSQIGWPEGSKPSDFAGGFKPGAEVDLPVGSVVVMSGVFRGKQSTPVLMFVVGAAACN